MNPRRNLYYQLLWLIQFFVAPPNLAWAQNFKEIPCPNSPHQLVERIDDVVTKHGLWLREIRDFVPGLYDDEETDVSSLLSHKGWKGQRASLCNMRFAGNDWSGVKLAGADLRNISAPRNSFADSDFRYASLNSARVIGSNFSRSNLSGAAFTNADARSAIFNHAQMTSTDLSGSRLGAAQLSRADLAFAKLIAADLSDSNLRETNLSNADLTRVTLARSDLSRAFLIDVRVRGAVLGGANLTEAIYAPIDGPPDPYVAGITGLKNVTFPEGRGDGLVQLRGLLLAAGLRQQEREATYAIEVAQTGHALRRWTTNPTHALEAVFRKVLFEWTSGYGLYPFRPLALMAALWLVCIPIYRSVIANSPAAQRTRASIHICASNGTHERGMRATRNTATRNTRLIKQGLSAWGWSAYISLLSMFHIGFRELSLGTWITRIQPHDFSVELTGWIRSFSGVQSLLSVYFFALCLLTYFGRPFQ